MSNFQTVAFPVFNRSMEAILSIKLPAMDCRASSRDRLSVKEQKASGN